MIGPVWIIALIAPIIAGSFVYLFKLFETADSMRKQIAECAIWNGNQYPMGVADIHGNYDWNTLVGGYYVAVDRVYRMIGRASVLALLLFVLGVLTVLSSNYLEQIPLRNHISALALAQLVLLGCSIAYFFWAFSVVNEKSWVKGEVDFAVARCRQAYAQTVTAASPVPAPTILEKMPFAPTVLPDDPVPTPSPSQPVG